MDDPNTIDTGVAGSPVVDMGAYEYFEDCDSSGLPDECDVDCGPVGGTCDLPGCGQSDCNANGVPDACDIAECDISGVCVSLVCVGGLNNGNACADDADCVDLPCNDCNLNGVPDACDIGNLTSADADMNGVLDECVEYIGPSSGNWSEAGNWNGNVVPDNGVDSFSVTLKGTEDNVVLNLDVTIDSLSILPGAGLEVTGGDLTIATAGGILIAGGSTPARAAGAATMIVEAGTVTNPTVTAPNLTVRGAFPNVGIVQVGSGAEIHVADTVHIGSGGVYEGMETGGAGDLSATTLLITGTDCDNNGGSVTITDKMIVTNHR